MSETYQPGSKRERDETDNMLVEIGDDFLTGGVPMDEVDELETDDEAEN